MARRFAGLVYLAIAPTAVVLNSLAKIPRLYCWHIRIFYSRAVLGTAAYLMLEEILSGYTLHWHVILGPVLILVVLFAKRGIFGSSAAGTH